MKSKFQFALKAIFTLTVLMISAAGSQTAAQCVSLASTAAYSENFDSLASAGTGTIPPPVGFSLAETGGDNAYTASNGTSSAQDTYSYGGTGSTERALGSQTGGTITPIRYGGCFTNNTGLTLGSFTVQYAGEQWRAGTAASDSLVFEYSTNATSLTSGAYVDEPALNFNSIVSGGGSLNGNDAANRRIISSTISANLSPNETIWIRWTDVDVSGSDHGLAIDDLVLTPMALTAAGVTIAGQVKNVRGTGIRRALIMLSGGDLAAPLYQMTDDSGYYRFEEISVGNTYILSVFAKKYVFAQPTVVLSLNESVGDLDFTANAGKLSEY